MSKEGIRFIPDTKDETGPFAGLMLKGMDFFIALETFGMIFRNGTDPEELINFLRAVKKEKVREKLEMVREQILDFQKSVSEAQRRVNNHNNRKKRKRQKPTDTTRTNLT